MRDWQLHETAKEREVRLQCDRQRQRDQQLVRSQLPLFEQHSIRAKMHKFHAHFAMVDLSTCTTCLESFPGLQLHLGSAECLRCCRDKHIPKLYSSSNNMDPGPIPSKLQVDSNITVMSSYVTDVFLLTRINTSGRNVDFWCATNHVTVPTTSWAVRIQWTHHQPATRCGFLRQFSATIAH